jgi:hypothetical protein
MHEVAMNEHTKQMHYRHAFLGFFAVLGIAAIASCASSNPPPGEKRVEHAGDSQAPPIYSADPDQDASSPPAVGQISPLDRAISEICPARPWSKNVPDRACTKDSECGDGFCDRDHCAAIWTCDQRYGQRCYGPEREKKTGWCRGLCSEGRCRSCLSNEDCITERDNSAAECGPTRDRAGLQGCGIRFDKPPNISPGRIPPDGGDEP